MVSGRTNMNTSSHIHLDIVGGIAGDMFVSAILDAFEMLRQPVLDGINQVLPAHVGRPSIEQGINLGVGGLRFYLAAEEKQANEHHHHHSHETTYQSLCKHLENSDLATEVIEIAVELLTIIGKAEAKIHQTPLEQVHFHELADWDSLMDVVAIAVILQSLSSYSWSLSKVPLGGGLIQTQHGLIPSPAPATAEILKGFEFIDDGVQGERITPTGAAVLRFLQDNDLITATHHGTLGNTGYGLGSKTFDNMPNILRAMAFSQNIEGGHNQHNQVVSIEFDIDDMTAEELALSLDILRQHQAVIDVIVQSARGKKNRGVELVRLLTDTEQYQQVIEQCFLQTSTIGLRYRFENRICLSRTQEEHDCHTYKSVVRPDHQITAKIEHDHLKKYLTLQERRAVKYQTELSAEKGQAL